MDKKIKELVKQSIQSLIEKTRDEKVGSLIQRHSKKMHFIPIRYRVIGGLLQSLNIQFGNYIEELIHLIVKNEEHLEIIEQYSGKKNIELRMATETDNLIDNYITQCQSIFDISSLNERFAELQDKIIKSENNPDQEELQIVHDIDVLFKDKRTGNIYYLEVKYNDDHDTGKYIDINRKFIKTYAALIRELRINETNKDKFIPILYYLNEKILKGNIYIPEDMYIYRGEKLFDSFFSISYKELDDYMAEIGKDEEIIRLFDDLYHKIRYEIQV